MSDIQKLKGKLSKLAETEVETHGAARQIVFARPAEGALAILDEVEETVLSRDIFLQVSSGHALSLTVKNRRLVRLNLPVPDTANVYAFVFGADLSTTQADGVRAIAQVLVSFCEGSGAITLQSGPPTQEAGFDEAGLATDAIRKALAEAGLTAKPDANNPLDTLITLTEQSALSWIRCKGSEIVQSSGSTGHTQALGETFVTAISHIHKSDRTAEVGTDVLQHWIFGDANAPYKTTISTFGSEAIVALVPAASLNDWITACRSCA